MMSLTERLLEIDASLERHRFQHAFGGALALAWCTEMARGTIDVDVNIFVDVSQAHEVVGALPTGVVANAGEIDDLIARGQVRLRWDGVPIDLFLNTHSFHAGVASRVRLERFAGRDIPFLACSDLAVFKVMYDRPKDWVDLTEMVEFGSIDIEGVAAQLIGILGSNDPRIGRLTRLAAPSR